TMTALAVLGLLPHGSVSTGSIRLDGTELLGLAPRRLRAIRGRRVALVSQDPATSLHPILPIRTQMTEHMRHHLGVSKTEARARSVSLLADVRIPDPEQALDSYPGQFSGGMRQRIAIAVALAAEPELLIADEPTTALDVTVQAQILDLIVDLQAEFGSAVIIITHDLGVVAEVADDILVMYAGRVAENGSAGDVFREPGHPYTWGLLSSMPRLDVARLERLRPIRGTPPSLIHVPSGCPFHPRCNYPPQVGGDRCSTEIPVLLETGPGHRVACHLMLAKQQELWAQLAPGSATAAAAAADETAAAEAAASAEPGDNVTEVEAP
ncbi:MAG TPA: ABC transporter ATP-binding protein, partial [Streptosporangiaceae bacterium]